VEMPAGEKRKRAIEPDGAPDAGIRGMHAPPAIETSASKKMKTNVGDAMPTSAS